MEVIYISKKKCVILGFAAGVLNGLLGAGGGMVIIPLLNSTLDTKKSHATCVSIILPLCVVSAIWYLAFGRVSIKDAYIYMLAGIPGAFLGSYLLSKVNKTVIKKAFAILVLWAAIRSLFIRH